ncbi:hypothetical protein F2Q68_00021028 [Brassica cretica]|uniref:Uncharacterized protein n=1 Tax=Brassica cretica TaxID=69181 RepID=A0A8S9FZ46_BRACR|nr:hypothetical protein F2Q68_00021028 [Brassica cretica]
MPDCMRGYGQSIDRLDRSLVWSIKRLRAVTPSTLSEVFVWPVSRQRVRASLGSLLVAWHPIPHWAIPLSLTPHSSPFRCRQRGEQHVPRPPEMLERQEPSMSSRGSAARCSTD